MRVAKTIELDEGTGRELHVLAKRPADESVVSSWGCGGPLTNLMPQTEIDMVRMHEIMLALPRRLRALSCMRWLPRWEARVARYANLARAKPLSPWSATRQKSLLGLATARLPVRRGPRKTSKHQL